MRYCTGGCLAGGRVPGPSVCARDRADPNLRVLLRIRGRSGREERVPDRVRARAVRVVPQLGRVRAMPRSYARHELYRTSLYLYGSRSLLAGMLLYLQYIGDCGIQLQVHHDTSYRLFNVIASTS